MFRAKLLSGIVEAGLELPECYPKIWVVDVKSVGAGDKALVYLGRYLYKGVIQEKDILACKDGLVTFRYQDGKTKQMQTRTLPGANFCGWSCSMCCPRVSGVPATLGSYIPTARSCWHCCKNCSS